MGSAFRPGLLGSALLLAGCAAFLTQNELNGLQARGEFTQAAARVEKAKTSYGAKNALLYELDRGLLLQLAGDYKASNQAFESAKRTAQDLFTKSITQEASTFLISDNARPYYGEDFERALIHAFAAINYAALGEPMEAVVECRQVDFLLRNLQLEQKRKNAHTEDAFARYLAGLLYEEAGEVNDAYISYYKALEAYDKYAKLYGTPRPAGLLADARRTARRLGFDAELLEMEKKWGKEERAWAPGTGEVVVLHYNGLAPHKIDAGFEIGVKKGWTYVQGIQTSGEETAQVERAGAAIRAALVDDMVRVVLPAYAKTPYTVVDGEVRAASVTARSLLVEDIGAIAKRNLDDRMLRTSGKAIARAVVKFLVTKKVSEKVGEKKGEDMGRLVKGLLRVASAWTETADKRAWRTLPDQIRMARLALPAGTQNLEVKFMNAAGAVAETRMLEKVSVKPGQRTFVVVRSAV